MKIIRIIFVCLILFISGSFLVKPILFPDKNQRMCFAGEWKELRSIHFIIYYKKASKHIDNPFMDFFVRF